jgi:hypothetical protein
MKKPIIITGIPRSGKGMIAGILNICGIFTGNVDKRFENSLLNHSLIEPYCVANGMDADQQKTFVPTKTLSIPNDWKESVDYIWKQQGAKDDEWLLKSAQASLMWPVWNHAYPDAKWIIVRRRTGDIVSSCTKTAYMKAHGTEQGWLDMCREHEQRFVEMINAGLNCKVIWPHRMAYGDYQQIYELLEWLGLSWDTDILNWVDPKFAKIRKK